VSPLTSAVTGYSSAHSLMLWPRAWAVNLSRSSITTTECPRYPSNHFVPVKTNGSSPNISLASSLALNVLPVPGGPSIHSPLVPVAWYGLIVYNLN